MTPNRARFDRNNELIRRYQEGDRAAGDELLRLNEALIATVARKFLPQTTGCLEFDDLMQLGRLGLLRAAHKFDPSRGCAFSTVAVPWVRQSIERGVADTGRLIRVPIAARDRARSVGQEWERYPAPLSIDYMCGEERDTLLSELLPCPERVEEPVIAAVTLAGLMNAAQLTPLEREVIGRRWGLNEKPEETLAEVGVAFGRSRERIRQMENAAMRKLIAAAQNAPGSPYSPPSPRQAPTLPLSC